ncbi:uncharacterized protein [Anabrus simplex]|uniref:uncharacterized protein n=1 Tax=Anabrus simplex TaxID=316456 RepID=UPI0035A3438B
MASGSECKTEYDLLRDNNIDEFRERFLEAFSVQIAEGTIKDPRRRLPSPPQRQPVRRSRRNSDSTLTRTRKPVRRSARLCRSMYASVKKPERGFMGFPVSQFFRITKYKDGKITADRVADDETGETPELTEDMEFTFCLSAPIPLDLIPAEYSTPEMLGNGWKDGVELDSDDDVEVNLQEDVTNATSDKDDSIEEAEPRHSKPRKQVNRVNTFPILRVEDVTPALLKKICYGARKSRDGVCTTCHQCRQKTSDTKSICRSGKCHGLRGMFCGYCLKRRYGEDVADVLLDPNWACPPCRDLCNCSICRSRANLPPTGILFPEASRRGFKCVADYLMEIEQD